MKLAARSRAPAGQHRARLPVGAELVGAVDRQQFGQSRARAVDARPDVADRAAADIGGLSE